VRGDDVLWLGNPSTERIRAAMRAGWPGAIDTPAQGNVVPDGVPYALDNGCFGAGYPGERAWMHWLSGHRADPALCLFAVAPDVVADAAATWERSAPWLPAIRALGYPAAFVAQNGLEQLTVPWNAFDVLFIGGDTTWKLGPHARRLAGEAVARGKRVHMGRVNSLRRLRIARSMGATTADGTILAKYPDRRLPDVLAWERALAHPELPLGGETA
jgi:hypothetical protein